MDNIIVPKEAEVEASKMRQRKWDGVELPTIHIIEGDRHRKLLRTIIEDKKVSRNTIIVIFYLIKIHDIKY